LIKFFLINLMWTRSQ